MKTTTKVLDFSDYRAFLLAYAQEMKSRSRTWTLGAWARHLGLKDTSSINKILLGKRNPGRAITERLIRYFAFSAKEAQYFRDLVTLKKVEKDPHLKVLLIEKIRQRHPKCPVRILDDQTFRVISQWFHLPVREMTRLKDFQEDPDWIASHLRYKTTPREIRHAIDSLISVGLLKRDATGALEPAEAPFGTSEDIASEAIRRHHEQMLSHAITALRETSTEKREITSYTFAMNERNLPRAKELIRKFKEDLSKLLEEEKTDGVYQFQMQLFPLTKANQTKEKKQ